MFRSDRPWWPSDLRRCVISPNWCMARLRSQVQIPLEAKKFYGGNCTRYKYNKTGLQPVSRPVEQSYGFLERCKKRCKWFKKYFIKVRGAAKHLSFGCCTHPKAGQNTKRLKTAEKSVLTSRKHNMCVLVISFVATFVTVWSDNKFLFYQKIKVWHIRKFKTWNWYHRLQSWYPA